MMHERNNAQSSQEKKDSPVFHQQYTQYGQPVLWGGKLCESSDPHCPSGHNGAARAIPSHMEAHSHTHHTHPWGAHH